MPTSTAPPKGASENGRPDAPQAAEIARVFEAQRNAFKRQAPPSLDKRRRRLRHLRDRVMERRADIQSALYADFRKPPEEVDLSEIKPVTAEIDHVLSNLEDWMKPQSVSTPAPLLGTHSAVRHEPKGVALIISPWNYPVGLTFGPLAGALAAGNRVILKPSEHTPHAARLMREITEQVFGQSEVALFEGAADTAQALLEHPFDHIYFTGSPAVGKIVMKAAAEHLASVTLELGGKSPAIVDASADVDDAARKIVWGKFTNSGQTCIAPDYVLAHEGQQAALVYAMRRYVRTFYGDTDEDRRRTPDYARMVNEKHFERVKALLDEAVEQGAHVSEGGAGDAEDNYLAPTILTEVPREARVMEEEIFGPVLPVVPFATLDEAVATVNERPNPLALYLFSRSEANTEYVLRRTTAGGTCLGDTLLHYLNPHLPFGGAGHSGIGKGHGRFGFEEFSNRRAVLERRFGSSAMEWLYPPYGDTARRLVDTMMKWL